MEAPLNVLGGPLAVCSHAPKTGFYRDGCCNTGADDVGCHTVCVQATEEFLAFSRSVGNDLSTPLPWFPGLRPGDRWCLCASRWQEAYEAGCAPPVFLAGTHARALDHAELDALLLHALDAGEA